MKNEHVSDLLSAYLDGECADPGGVARHLEKCAMCAERHEQLRRISKRLAEMPGPAAGDLFTARVMNAIAREPNRASEARRRWVVFSAAALVAAAALISVSAWFILQSPERHAPEEPKPITIANAWNLEESAAPAAWTETGPFSEGASEDEPGEDQWLDTLAEDEWFIAMADSLDETADLDSLLTTLEENEAKSLGELLNEYAG